jgi:peptidyl-prolyl cis-trans isomerase B (cyclophilin B)
MNTAILCTIGLLALTSVLPAEEPTEEPTEARTRMVEIETTKGNIVLELDAAAAPETVASFVENVEQGFYEGTIFHRVIKDFMIQGGGLTPNMELKETRKSVQNEADNGLKNDRGTVAMARKGDPHSASVQFFINTVDNDFLNHKGPTPQGWGYAVFGRVVEGMEVVDAIASSPTGPGDVPREQIAIVKATLR